MDQKAYNASIQNLQNMLKGIAGAGNVSMMFEEVAVNRRGAQIILPENMSYDEGITWLKRKKEEEEQVINISEDIVGYPLDAALAFTRTLADKYGWTGLVPTPGFFGDNPPQFLSVPISHKEVVQVPWGRVTVPTIDSGGYLQTKIGIKDNQPILVLGASVKRKFQKEVQEIARLTRDRLRENSIYRGQPIRVKFPEPGEEFDIKQCPQFLDVSTVREEELIFNEETAVMVENTLFTPIETTALCRAQKIPLKRGILLEGRFGTGKTLTAFVAAKKCIKNGWTFILVESITQLRQALLFARQYAPALIFAEDIDQVLDGDRDGDMNDILNTIDGIETKHYDIITVLTTNNLDKIHPAMLRPGRLDAVISVNAPDAPAVQKLLSLYGRGMIKAGEDLTNVGKMLAGQIPASIREVLERSKLAAVSRFRRSGAYRPGMDVTTVSLDLTAADLEVAARGMLNHLKLLEPKKIDNRTPLEVLGDRVGDKIFAGVTKSVENAFEASKVS